MNISISPLTLEVKLRYASAFLFLGFFIICISPFTPLDLLLDNSETGLAFAWGIYLFIPLLLWSLFNRWYFMVPAMVVLIVLITFTIVIAMVHSHFIEENELLIPIGLFVEGLAFVSFEMYIHRNIKGNNRSAYFNLGIRIISFVILMFPWLIFYILAQLLAQWQVNFWDLYPF